MSEEKYKAMLTFLLNHGQVEMADDLFRLMIRSKRMAGENIAYATALSNGIVVHIHNDGSSQVLSPIQQKYLDQKVREHLKLDSDKA